MSTSRIEIESRIPHRAPFLFVDRIVEETEDHLVAEWKVPPEAWFFQGHYPSNPVTPGVILSEHAFQCAALMISALLGDERDAADTPVLTKIERARYKRIVRPAETVTTRVHVTERLGPAWYMAARVTCDGATAVDIRFVLTSTGAMARLGEAAG
ncbi:MAG TPA: beta-hydroxyacyl-ACP dehydratase [Planctomycetes bacterium]|nr:beta-hydroxyacyl-ACP dehydratase [Planctomycetota bacterium]